MCTKFIIRSSDPELLEKAIGVAREFTQQYMGDDVVGIVFLGAIARGYFDRSANIDIAIFKKRASEIPVPNKFLKIDGFEVQCWLSDYESELTSSWDMPKRWTYAQGQVYFDTGGNPAPNTTVSGSWSNGYSGNTQCVTAADGTCTVTTGRIRRNVGSVTFTVTNLAQSGYTYNPAANQDPDGDSNGTVIVVSK